ncbi:isoflavone 2'-hydroxylase-like [Zingiber officinale]|uniref:isoflavone 2'-hydroxylase-like n=1 Tax=Zingiber officinale TaxID=94328 RepID=UPI001C4CEEF2|nr:isoflavone 2'-hydroxylase-like [Zingiber officinale]
MSIEIFLLPSLFLFLLLIFCRRRQNHRRLPPSPPSFSILGHLHLFNPPIHRSPAAISAAHGPVVLLHFGSRPILLVSSPSAVEECFTILVLDVAFANHPRFLAGKILGYDFIAILWVPYGSHWRRLRHITSMHLLAFDSLHQDGGSGGAPRRLDLKSTLFDLVCAIIEQLVVSLIGETQEQRLIIKEIVSEGLQLSAAAANAGDDMPEFMRVTWHGLEKRLMRLQRRRDEFWGKLIVLHRERRQSEDNGDGVDGEGRETVMDVMLSLQNRDPERYTDDIIKRVMMVRAHSSSYYLVEKILYYDFVSKSPKFTNFVCTIFTVCPKADCLKHSAQMLFHGLSQSGLLKIFISDAFSRFVPKRIA